MSIYYFKECLLHLNFHIYSNLYFRSCPANIRYRPA
nr:MAG TPA: hypothetical protein [Caudoviricetes sp.]